MQTTNGADRQWDVSNSEAWNFAILEQTEHARNEDESPRDDKRDVENAKSVEVNIEGHGVPICEGHDDG